MSASWSNSRHCRETGNVKVAGVTGRVVAKIDTPSGAIVVGGKGPNTYDLDRMRNVAAVIDLGGGNTYYEGSVGLDRPVLLVITLGGNNTFSGSQPGIQGGAVLGVSMLLTLGDNNTYQAQDVAQGSALAGVGIQIDYGAHNRYRGSVACKGKPSAAWASAWAAADKMTITPPFGLKAWAARWDSACWTTPKATTIIIAAECGAIPIIPKRPAMKAGAKASAAACGRLPVAASV